MNYLIRASDFKNIKKHRDRNLSKSSTTQERQMIKFQILQQEILKHIYCNFLKLYELELIKTKQNFHNTSIQPASLPEKQFKSICK